MREDLAGLCIVGGAFLLLLGVAELWSRLGNAKPEWTRKLVHFGGGAACLGLPWLVQSPWSVLLLALSASLLIASGRRCGLLQGLHGVSRVTFGSEYYPLAIFLVFVVSEGRGWLYLSSVLVLAVADASAALVGIRYGSRRYTVEDREKTVEGSLTFLAVSLVAMVVPMLLLTDLPHSTAWWSALLVAVLVTGFEAIALSGADNLFVPLGVCVILSKITSKPLAEIVYQNLSLLGITGAVSLLAWRVRAFNTGGALVLLLFVYGSWSLGSELWAAPVVAAFLLYLGAWLVFPGPPGGGIPVRVRLVFRVVLVPLLLLVTGNMLFCGDLLYIPFVGAVATALGISLWNHVMERNRTMGNGRRAGLSALTGATAGLGVTAAAWLSAIPRVEDGVPVVVLAAAATFASDRVTGPHLTLSRVWGAAQLGLEAVTAAAFVLLRVAGY